ncbi:hypothetical protein I4U23_013108 [Adineta vaga]|nr:hypothetical protein I4U23_013108 [Adineta vaga]
MNYRTDIHLLDLPVEILFNILKRLNNLDVLYSLIGVKGLDCLARNEIFTNTLSFGSTDGGEDSAIDETKLNRFCDSILPQIHNDVKSLVCDAKLIDRILRAGVYLNLTQLKITGYLDNTFPDICTVNSLGDCFYLLDGRLMQLSSFIVIIEEDEDYSPMEFNENNLNHLKCFSLTSKSITNEYNNQIVPLLRRMLNLQDLTLYLQIKKRHRIVDGIQLENDILSHLSKLQRFVFYISTGLISEHSFTRLSNDDIQRTFTNFKFGEVGWTMNDLNRCLIRYHIFSLPYKFYSIEAVGNQFTNTIYKNVTAVWVSDSISFEHEFFLRLARCFPSLRYLNFAYGEAQQKISVESQHNDNILFEIVEFPHLKTVIFGRVHIDYVEEMLNESKTRLPCLTEIWVHFDDLKSVTNNFTRDATRINCLNLKNLVTHHSSNNNNDDDVDFLKRQSPDFYRYFPSLKL